MADACRSTDRRTILSAAPLVLAGGLLAAGAGLAASGDPDARFWALHARWQQLEQAWEGEDGLEGGEDEAVWDAAAAEVSAALDAMMLISVHTVAGVLAKFRACQGQEILLGKDRRHSSLTVIAEDLERLAAKERQA